MKKLFMFSAAILFLGLSIPWGASAMIIGQTSLAMSYSDPIGKVTFPSTPEGTYYLDYDATYTWGSELLKGEIFCVENVMGTTSYQTYTLYTIDNSLSQYGFDPDKYMKAAWIAQNYYSQPVNQDYWKAAAQVAIWEVIFDPTYSLTAGSFLSNNLYNSSAQQILAALGSANPLASSEWALAINPNYQNYLVHNPAPVPEPATLILLGSGLLGLAGLGRRMKKQ